MNRETLTRKQLYDLVWSTPMLTLSKKYEISDVGLRKMCLRMSIPLPRAGHWEKLRAGKRVEKFVLSPNYKGENQVILTLRKEGDSGDPKTNPVKLLQEELRTNPDIDLIVPRKLSTRDKRVIEAREALANKKYADKGLVFAGYGHLDIGVAPANVSRALRFMDTLIKAVEARGCSVEIQGYTYVMLEDQRMKIQLRERLKKGEKLTTWGSPEYIPTGKFYFKLDDYPRREWNDNSKTIEEQLPAIVARLEIQGREMLADQVKRKREREEQAENDRIALELKERKEQDLSDFIQGLQASARWHKATNFRNYIDSIEQNALKQNEMSDNLSTWLAWARQKADWYDPFTEKEDELLNDVDRETLTFREKHGWY